MHVYISTGAFLSSDLNEIIDTCRQAGIKGLELSSGLDFIEDVSSVVAQAKVCGPLLLHNYFPAPRTPFVLNLASDDADTIMSTMALCRRAMQLSAGIGAPFYSVHSGFVANLPVEMLGHPEMQGQLQNGSESDYESAYIRFRERVRVLCDEAAELGIRLVLENNVITQHNLGSSLAPQLLMTQAHEFLRLMEELNHPALGILVDVGHVNVAARTLGFEPQAFIETLSEHIVAFHLSENNGLQDTNDPLSESSWFLPLLKHFPDAVFVLEAYRLSTSRIIQQKALIQKHIQVKDTSYDEIDQRQHSILS